MLASALGSTGPPVACSALEEMHGGGVEILLNVMHDGFDIYKRPDQWQVGGLPGFGLSVKPRSPDRKRPQNRLSKVEQPLACRHLHAPPCGRICVRLGIRVCQGGDEGTWWKKLGQERAGRLASRRVSTRSRGLFSLWQTTGRSPLLQAWKRCLAHCTAVPK